MSFDIKTVILHCKSLRDRKVNMIQQMEKFGFTNYSFYEEFDGNELTESDISSYYAHPSISYDETQKKASVYDHIIPNASRCVRPLNIPQMSLTIKHGKVFEMLARQEEEMFIVFEDDVILCEDFVSNFRKFLSFTPNDWDVISFGTGAGLKPDSFGSHRITKEQVAYLMPHPASRCTDSMLFKKSAVVDLAKTWFPFHIICDWELSYQHYLHNHKVYWWEPGLVVQGSECGKFNSVLR